MGYVATNFDVMNFNFDLLDYSSEVSLFPPTPPPMPSSPLEILVVEPLQGDSTEIVLVNEPVEIMKDELVLPDSKSDDTFDGDGVSLPPVLNESIIEPESEIVIVLPPTLSASIIEPKIVVSSKPIIEKEPEHDTEYESEHDTEYESEHEPKPNIWEINFDCLPMEIVIHIFQFLGMGDLKIASLVCRRWLSANTYKKFNKNLMLNCVDSFYKNFKFQISSFATPIKTFPIVNLTTGNFDIAAATFWTDYGGNIKELYFRNGILRKAEFEEIVRWTPHLHVLKIESNNLFRTWDIRGTYHERLIQFHNCYHISLRGNSFLSKKIFEYVVATAPNLQEIDLSNCMPKMSAKDRNQFLDHLVFYLKGYGENIKLLNFTHTITDDFFLQQLSEIRKLKLRSLSLTYNGSIADKKFGLLPLIASQTSLEYLDISESPAVEETILVEICKHLTKLKYLNLRKCCHVTDYCVREIVKLENLEVLNLSSCEYVTDEGINDGLVRGSPKKNLKELHFSFLSNITAQIIFTLAIKYHSNVITVLDLGGSTNVNDEALQMIFAHFNLLRNLNLDSCCNITDYGLTGVSHDERPNTHISISNLRGLKNFHSRNCYKITDKSLVESFKLIELKELDMARCHFGKKGVEALTKNCPSIECLDLTECENLDDDVVENITVNLHRLKTLKLNGCEKLTEKIFDHIYKNCEEIKFLYLRNCPNIVADRINEQLYYMRTLRKVYLE